MRWCIGLTLLGFATAGRTETDIWGHTAIGLDMLSQGRFLWVDPYSFTSDQLWVNHEWLWDIATASLYRVVGLPGILLLRAAIIGTVLWLVNRATAPAPAWVRTVTLMAVALVCLAQLQSTRPQIASLALYAVTLAQINAWWLPILFAVWANLHGGWMIGLGAVGLYALSRPTHRSVVLVCACAFATAVNPYGFHLWLALAEAIGRGWGDVQEWAPVWSRAAGIAPLWLWLSLVTVVVMLWRHVAHDRWAWSLTILTLVAGANSRRLLAFAGVTAAMLLVNRWRPAGAEADWRWTPTRRAIAVTAVAVGLLRAWTFVQPTVQCFPSEVTWIAPEAEAVDFMRASGARKAVTYFDFGEYAIFHLRGLMQVSMDNRRETVYSRAVLDSYHRFRDGRDPDYPTKIGADAVWWPAAKVESLTGLDSRGWHRRFEGPRTVVLLKAAGQLMRAADGPLPCFPNP
jgi:hypothetical protein